LDDLHPVIAAEIFETRGTGAIPLKNYLIVIGDDEQVRVVVRAENPEKPILALVRVLVFVDADVRIDYAVMLGDPRSLSKQPQTGNQQCSVVQMIVANQGVQVRPVDRTHPGLRGTRERQRSVSASVMPFAEQVIDHSHNAISGNIRHVQRAVALDCLIKYAQAVGVSSEYIKVRAQPQVTSVLAEHLGAE
jgi:hypothetical protein